jgi:hypothetical protein
MADRAGSVTCNCQGQIEGRHKRSGKSARQRMVPSPATQDLEPHQPKKDKAETTQCQHPTSYFLALEALPW